MNPTDGPWKHTFIHTPGIRLHAVIAGEGPLLLLLHGFPECWYSWRHQIPALAAAGFRVVAPDLRGYNTSDKPATGYDVDTLAQDVIALLDHFGARKAIIAGHDWGGAVAWSVALAYPDRVAKLMALNIPHPTLLARALRGNPRQMLRSLYILFFQIPALPEWLIRRKDYQLIERAFRGTAVHPERFTDADIAVYKAAASQPGALTAMLNYYRCLQPGKMIQWARGGPPAKVSMPTLLIWGKQDQALGVELTYRTADFVPDLRIRYIPVASHWVQQDQPEVVTRAMLEFLQEG